jgi:DNA-binding NarL/FixJ family response regulator
MRRTVLIVDDHEAFRESAAALLEAEGFAVVGEAADGGSAIAPRCAWRESTVRSSVYRRKEWPR